MATRSHSKVEDTVDDIPDFNHDGGNSHPLDDLPSLEHDELTTDLPEPPMYNGTSQVVATFSWDDLNNVEVDVAKHEAEYRKTQLPRGDWIKEDRWEFDKDKDVYVKVGDCAPGDIRPEGRLFLTFRGYTKPRIDQGYEYNPYWTMRLSPDIRFKEDAPDKHDMMYSLYMNMMEIHLAVKGEQLKMPRLFDKLAQLIMTDKFTLQGMSGDNGAFVMRAKPFVVKRGAR